MRIRPEEKSDCEAISRLQYAAFLNHPVHQPGTEPTEHRIVERLRAAGGLELSLVALGEQGNEDGLLGHLALSAAAVGEEQEDWYLLGPVGVWPGRQRQGIGSALIRETLRVMQDCAARGVVLVGDPAYYARFGFRTYGHLEYPGVPHQYVLALVLRGSDPVGAITAHPAFSG